MEYVEELSTVAVMSRSIGYIVVPLRKVAEILSEVMYRRTLLEVSVPSKEVYDLPAVC